MEAKTEGFRVFKRAEFALAVDQTQRISTLLWKSAPLQRESGTRGEVISKEEIAEIPLGGRNFSDLAYLTGGVIPKGDGGDGAYIQYNIQPKLSRDVLARNWQIAGTSTIYTGPPFSPRVANFNCTNGEGIRTDRICQRNAGLTNGRPVVRSHCVSRCAAAILPFLLFRPQHPRRPGHGGAQCIVIATLQSDRVCQRAAPL
jgi:hypothetical protein